MRAAVPLLSFLVLACGSPKGNHPGDAGADAAPPPDACVGLRCALVTCPSGGTTSVSGTVYAPNGTLPLYGVDVYVPAVDPGPLPVGVSCDRCDAQLPGDPIVKVKTDEAGHFRLDGIPVSPNLLVVVQVGKWRRQITLATVPACMDTPLTTAQTTLPKDRSEGDMPQIAITTGSADALECLIRKVGISDKEMTTDTDATSGKVHLFSGNGAASFDPTFPGGARPFGDATTLWGTVDKLKAYDIVIFSCEGAQYSATKPLTAMNAVAAYSDLGGRVFMSHWHNIWLEGNTNDVANGAGPHYGPDPSWANIAMFTENTNVLPDGTLDSIDLVQPKGSSFATWLVNVAASTTRGLMPVTGGKLTCTSIDNTKADRWVYVTPQADPAGVGGVQTLQFTTPQSHAPADRCGKVVFSDMHVASGSQSDPVVPFPGSCATGDLSPQEKALAFMFFDIDSCVGGPLF